MKKLAIIGAGGHGKVVADLASMIGWNSISFFDAGWKDKLNDFRWPILGDTSNFKETFIEFDGVLIAIGDCKIRWKEYLNIKNLNSKFVTLKHPHATISQHSRIGDGSVILASSVVNIDAEIGNACIINVGATVDHDCILGNSVHVAPGAHISGGVTIGDLSWIGIGSAIKQGVHIGKNVMVGAGAVVISDIPDNVTVVGNPARTMI
jgi:sugar O-acyltransferase (sialic acid O-acetyltransferase NeuD family)